MDAAQRKEANLIAAGYGLFALMYLAMATIFVSAGGWRGVEDLMQNIDVVGEALLLLSSLCILNVLLALGSRRVLMFSVPVRRLFLGTAVALAVVVVINNISGWWRWYQGTLSRDLGPETVVGGALVAIGYVYLAYSLMNLVSTSNRRIHADARKSDARA